MNAGIYLEKPGKLQTIAVMNYKVLRECFGKSSAAKNSNFLSFLCIIFLMEWMSLFGEYVDVVSYFSFEDFPVTLDRVEEAGYTVRTFIHQPNIPLATAESSAVKKIIVFAFGQDPKILKKFPQDKTVLFLLEPNTKPAYTDLFKTVYTFNDDLIDGKKYFKIHYPCLLPMRENLPAFQDKKLCTMVASNWKGIGRKEILRFFDTKPFREFEYYSKKPGPTIKNYKGSIQGNWRSEEKLSTLEQYRFCICFENTPKINGYITEKIFCCFAAGCIPIYWGAPNITNYIPKECFIDYRDFASNEELYRFIKTMDEGTYQKYIDAIQTYLDSPEAALFSSDQFNTTLLDAIHR